MPGLDKWRSQSRSDDRSRENQPRRSQDVVIDPASRVLALQRLVGNRATGELLRSACPTGAVLQRALRGMKGVVSGRDQHRLDSATGRRILEEFARNDPGSVKILEGVPEEVVAEDETDVTGGLDASGWMLDTREWGLIREHPTADCPAGEVHLIFGGKTGVVWGPYLNHGTLLAHSHPMRQLQGWSTAPRSIKGGPISIDDLITRQDAATLDMRVMVLPTVSDFVFPFENGQTKHTVFTPYVADSASKTVRNPKGTKDPQTKRVTWERTARLTWELTEIKVDKEKQQMTAHLAATAGGQQFWASEVQAPTTDRRSVNYTLIPPQPAVDATTAQSAIPQPVAGPTSGQSDAPHRIVGATTGQSDE